MSDVIRFLENMGANAGLANQSAEAFLASVNALQLAESERDALLRRDGRALAVLLDGRETLYCLVFPAEDDDKPQEQPEDDTESPDERDAPPPPNAN